VVAQRAHERTNERFDYPNVLRRPTHEVLERFRAGGTPLILIWKLAEALTPVTYIAWSVWLIAVGVALVA
jgi:hypothetical protein